MGFNFQFQKLICSNVTCTHTWKLAPLAMWFDTSLRRNSGKRFKIGLEPGKVGVVGTMQLKHHSWKSQMTGVSGKKN